MKTTDTKNSLIPVSVLREEEEGGEGEGPMVLSVQRTHRRSLLEIQQKLCYFALLCFPEFVSKENGRR